MTRIRTDGASWDSMFLAFVRVITTFATIIQTKLLALGLSLEEYGTYTQVNIVVSVGTALLLLGLPDAVNYFFNRNIAGEGAEEKRKMVDTIFGLEIIAGIAFCALAILCRKIIATYFSNDSLIMLLPIVVIRPMLENTLYLYQQLYVSTGKAKTIAVRNVLVAIVRLVAIYIAVCWLNHIKYILWALVVIDIIQLAFLSIYFAKDVFSVKPYRVVGEYVRVILTYSIPMGLYAITNMLSREIDKLVVGRLTNTETLAIYANCSKILPFDIIVVSFATVLIPYIMRFVSSNKKDKAATLFCNYMKIGYYSVWILGTAVLITSKQVISLLYTEEYVQGNAIFVIYIIDSMMKFASMHLILTAGGKSKLIMQYSLMTMLLNFALNILLYYAFGIAGPALATLLSTAIYTFLILRSSVELIGVSWGEVFDFADVLAFAGKLVITGIAFCVLNQLMLRIEINKYVSMLISAGGFCCLNLCINIKRIGKVLKEVNALRM